MPLHSRWIGRLACGCLALVVAAMAGVSPSAAGLGISVQVGTEPDPLVGPFPLSVRPGQTTAVGVSLFTGQGTGFVKPTVSCCVDATTGAQVTPAGLTMSFRLPVPRRTCGPRRAATRRASTLSPGNDRGGDVHPAIHYVARPAGGDRRAPRDDDGRSRRRCRCLSRSYPRSGRRWVVAWRSRSRAPR